MEIAVIASHTKILQVMFLRTYVLDVKYRKRRVGLPQSTIFAKAVRAPPDRDSDGSIHQLCSVRARKRRALA